MSNHIEHIEISNFKSIRNLKIEGCKRVNLLIGYPNVGKSAILEAISTLAYLQKDFNEPFEKLCRLKSSGELFFDGNIRERSSIKYSEHVQVGINYLNEFELDLMVLEFDLNYLIKDRITNLAIIKNLRFSKKGVDIVINNIEINKIITENDLLYKRISVKKYHFQNSFNDVRTNGLVLSSPFGENLVDIVQFNKTLRKEVGQLLKFYDLKLLIDQATNSIRGMKQLDEETVYTIPFYQMADTLQRLIFHKAAILSNENSVLLFEEPEAHMFPPYISQFTSDIIYNKENNNQYFIATHSPFVINDFMEDARDELSVFLVGLKKGETIIKRLSDEDLHKIYQNGVDLFFNIESYLD